MKKYFWLIVSALIFVACSSESPEAIGDPIILKSSDVELYFGGESQIQAESISKITYASENKFHAMVSESGLITAYAVGETNILLSNGSDTKKVKVTVNPTENLYPDPILQFGMSRNDIIRKAGTPDNETEDGISYFDYSVNAPIVMYFFENNRLNQTTVMVKSSLTSRLADHLGERYIPVSSEDNTTLFVNGLSAQNITMAVGVELYNSSYWMVTYFAYTPSSKSVQSKIDNNQAIRNLIGGIQ